VTVPTVYLVDTNSYLRVAKSANCVLGDHANLQLRLVREIAAECNRSARVKRLWPWLQEPPHPSQRAKWTLNFDAGDSVKVRNSTRELRQPLEDALEDYAARKRARGEFRPVLSSPDLAVFCTAEALVYGVVTDEGPMTVACKEFGVSHLSTLGLLHYLTAHKVLARDQVDAIVRFWQYEKDEPRSWRTEYRKLFGEPIPEFRY
jgi:hypothetical protein